MTREGWIAERPEMGTMNVRVLAILLLRLWGLVSLVRAVTMIVSALFMLMPSSQMDEQSLRYALMTYGLSAVVQLALGTVLLLAAPRIAGLLVADADDGDAKLAPPDNFTQLQAVLFGALGVFFAIAALREIAELGYAIVRHPVWDDRGSFGPVFSQKQEAFAGAVVQLIAAAALLINRMALAGAWSRIHPMTSETHGPDDPAE